MSLSEDCELQELVKQTLEKSGSLSKIRAELRASVFLTLEENGCFQNTSAQNTKLESFAKTADGVLLICLIREFFEYFGLSFTASVFDPELASYGVHCDCKDRSKLSNQLNVSSNGDDFDRPLLSQMLKIIRNIQGKPTNQSINSDTIKESNLSNCKSSDTSTEYLPLQSARNISHEAESKRKIKIDDADENILTKNEKVSDLKGKSRQAASDKNTEVTKFNFSSLEDLPPLTSSFTSSKSNSSSLNKSKQINMLKAALKDTINDGENSVTSDDDKNDTRDSSKLDDSIVEESQITAEDASS
ncbi:centrosomal protein 43-like [Planococcus citri]|uniref:centrosomal protein 43-like n=1 Tax=Planococcus citri TaxID=170843 RepID=UPI0031F78E54